MKAIFYSVFSIFVFLSLVLTLPNAPEGPTAERPPSGKRAANNEEAADAAKDAAADEENLMKEWEEKMSDFVPGDMLTVEVPSRGQEVFYEEVTVIPSLIRGAFFVSSDDRGLIDFYILNPNNQEIFKRRKKREAIFYFDAPSIGTYRFIFSNSKYTDAKDVTFAINTGNNTDTAVQAAELDPLEQKLIEIDRLLKDFQVEQKFAVKRQDSHNITIKSSHKTALLFAIVESLILLGLTGWQIYYIKRILDNRSII